VAAAVALVEVATERGGAAALERAQNDKLFGREGAAVP
jgi:hypothetical protein